VSQVKNSSYYILGVACIAEAATGLALLIAPGVIVSLLFGAELIGPSEIVSRIAGTALIALAIVCRPPANRAAYEGMLFYNALVALLLTKTGIVSETSGMLLWPTAALHAIFAILLAVCWSRMARQTASA